MVRKVTKFLVVMILAIMLLTPTVMGFDIQTWGTPGTEGSTFYIGINDKGLFCMNHGYKFVGNKNYRVYEHGFVSSLTLKNPVPAGGDQARLLSFIIGDMQRAVKNGEKDQHGRQINPATSRNKQEWQEAIWYYLGENRVSPTEYSSLVDEYKAYENIYGKKDDGITIEFDGDVAVANEHNMVGPFKLDYPYEATIEEYTDLTITMTNSSTGASTELFKEINKQILENKIKSDSEGNNQFKLGDKEFYIPISEVTYGTKYNFHVDWEFTFYDEAEYWKLTPPRTLLSYVECDSCYDQRLCYYDKDAYLDHATGNYVNASGTIVATNTGGSLEPVLRLFKPSPGDADFIGGYYVYDSETGTTYRHNGFEWIIASGVLPVGPSGLYGVFRGTNMSNMTHDHLGRTSMSPPDELDNSTSPSSHVYFANLTLNDNKNQTGFYGYGGDSGYQHGCQDYLYLITTARQIKQPDEIEVLVGQPNIKILLNKVNSLTKANVSGVEFEVSAEGLSQAGNRSSEYANVSSDGGTTFANPITITTTDSDMEIEIKPDNEKARGLINEITVSFKEIGLADETEYLMYRDENGDPGSIQMIYDWDTTTMEWKHRETKYPKYDNGVEEKAETFDVEKNSWKLTAENRPKIEELSGFVWIDGVTGEKNIQPPNGLYDGSEGFKEGVKVYLYKNDGSQVEFDGYGDRFGDGGEGYLITDGDGKYKFENIPKLPSGESYYIVFEYDGINYICTTTGGDSKATEKGSDRSDFNGKFKTISPGQSNGGITLNYNYSGNASTLITEDGDGVVYDDFAIKADTQTAGNTYTETDTDINLGIVKKVVDLALMTDLYEVTATINGINPPTVKKYNAIFDNIDDTVIDAMQNKTADGVEYNINLYRSDYNYRIGQYVNSPSISHQPSLATEEQTALQNSRAELVLTLEYRVLLANQSTTDASIDEFEFYYDSHLKFINITGGIATDGENKLTITPSDPSLGFGECKEVILLFEAVNLSNEQVVRNYAEITRYSTDEGGYVDCDSAPGNANIGSGAIQYEDDTDEAKGAKITLSLTDREVSGYVFEDKKEIVGDAPEYITGNGIYDNGETPIDDVIVQLIEIKNLEIAGKTHRLEYIWQETTSGSNIVRKISDDGTKIDTIRYQDAPETGKYIFRGFIPGDYIVRFIYGDGTYKDTAINQANILKYNGQDYKSTLDEKWNSTYLTTEGYSNADCSMARDNEARRLEVIAYAVGVTDGEDLKIDNAAKLENTWMAAETSKILVEDCLIDGVATFYRKSNFGLVEKPITKLSLKKHITYLKLDVGGSTVEASVPDVGSQYLDDSTVIKDFSSTGDVPIEATATTRTNRGYWQVEMNNTDGATVTIKYNYRVTNIGEPDYLSQELANKFKFSGKYEDDIKTYKEEIEKCAEEVKKSVKSNDYKIENTYLGHAYYSGKKAGSSDNKNGGDQKVKTYINLEDYLTDLSLDGTGSFEVIGNESKKIINKSGNEETETVKVIRTKNGEALEINAFTDFSATVNCAIASKTTFPSYIAQVITPITTLAGTKITDSTANNLEYVQSYYSVARLDDLGLGKGTESDEFWAETFRIIPTTGEDKESGLILTISITAGLAIIAIGIILIKRIIKE